MIEKDKDNITIKDLLERVHFFGKDHPTYWGCAIAGEVGELANLLKKAERENSVEKYLTDISYELADVFIYTILISKLYDIDLIDNILKKLEIVKNRRRYNDD